MSFRHAALALIAASSTACAIIDGLQGSGDRPEEKPSASWKWHGAVQIDVALPVRSDAPRLAVAPDGTAWVTWYEWKDVTQSSTIWVTNRSAGQSWATPQALPAISGWPVVTYPQIAVGPKGAPVLAFSADDGASPPVRSIRAARLQNGLTVQLSDIARLDSVSSNTPQMSQSKSVSVDDAGAALVAWGESSSVMAATSASGSTWTSAAAVDSNGAVTWPSIMVAAGAEGKAIIGFSRGDTIIGLPMGIGGSLTPGAKQTLAAGSNLPGPGVAMRGNRAMLAWRNDGGFVARAYNGDWGATSTIVEGQGDSWGSAAFAMNSKGQAVFLWRRYEGVGDSYTGTLWGAYFDGTQWSAPALVSLPGANRKAWWPSVDINDEGTAVAAWADFEETGTFTRIWANVLQFEEGAPTWKGPEAIDIASPDAGLAGVPENVRDITVGMDPGGKTAYVTYMQHEPNGTPRTWVNWLE